MVCLWWKKLSYKLMMVLLRCGVTLVCKYAARAENLCIFVGVSIFFFVLVSVLVGNGGSRVW